LKKHYAGQKVYGSGDFLVYCEQGNPKKVVIPDTFIAKGVMRRQRRTHKIREMRHVPDVIIETTSRKSKRRTKKTSRRFTGNWPLRNDSCSIRWASI